MTDEEEDAVTKLRENFLLAVACKSDTVSVNVQALSALLRDYDRLLDFENDAWHAGVERDLLT
jgi:hypothetical protein